MRYIFFTHLIITSPYSLELPAFPCLANTVARLFFNGVEVLHKVYLSTGIGAGAASFTILGIRQMMVSKKKKKNHPPKNEKLQDTTLPLRNLL